MFIAGLGFEPRYPPPKGGVLPLDDPAEIEYPQNTIKIAQYKGVVVCVYYAYEMARKCQHCPTWTVRIQSPQ